MDKNQFTRLGFKEGVNSIKTHPFFDGVDFNKISKMEVNPPHKPEIKGEDCINNFDEEFTCEELDQSLVSDNALSLIDQNKDCFGRFSK